METDPVWSPDGGHLAFSSDRAGGMDSGFREAMNSMRVIPAVGGESRLVAPVGHRPVGKRCGDGPLWSPDGRRMAFVSGGYMQVMPVSPTGDPAGPPRQLTHELADSISWAGSSQILYMATDRLKLVSIEDSGTKDVPIDLTWRLKVPTARRWCTPGA